MAGLTLEPVPWLIDPAVDTSRSRPDDSEGQTKTS